MKPNAPKSLKLRARMMRLTKHHQPHKLLLRLMISSYRFFNPSLSSSAQTVASIDDLLIQIFLCIPLKPLVRLKLVSKHWNFIISGENFNLLRNQKNPNPAVGLIFPVVDKLLYRPSSYVVSFDKQTNGPLFREKKFNSRWPLNSCNGLLLFKREGNGTIDHSNQRYYVCNPTTKKYFMLPKIDEPTIPFDWMYLAFDPSKSPHYKVVCVATTPTGNPNQLSVYSSETGCWRKQWETFSASVDFSRGVYWNGAIHWISKTNTGQSLYFNPDNDQVPQVMPTPPMITHLKPMDLPWSCVYRYFGESCGHLHYIANCKTVMELNVYEMRTDYSEWFLKYRVDCSLIDNRLISMLCALVRGKKDEDSFLVLQIGKRIIRYNLVYKTCETICELVAAGARFYPTWDSPLQYIESLEKVAALPSSNGQDCK